MNIYGVSGPLTSKGNHTYPSMGEIQPPAISEDVNLLFWLAADLRRGIVKRNIFYFFELRDCVIDLLALPLGQSTC